MGYGVILVMEVGQEVTYEGEKYTVGDIGFRSGDSFSGASAGKLQYLLLNDAKAAIGWVAYSDVTVSSEDFFVEEDEGNQKILEIGHNMVSWAMDLPERPDNSKLPEIITLLMAIQYDKEGFYGSSWKGRGEYRGIMANIDRKYDRLDKMTADELEGTLKKLSELEEQLKAGVATTGDIGESKIDAIADLTNYGMLYMTYVKENFPSVFKVWVDKNVPKYLAQKIPFLSK